MGDEPDQIAELLAQLAAGDERAAGLLMPHVYRELRGIAQKLMGGERRDHTLQTTALVNEAWVRMAGSAGLRVEDRDHFVRVAARAMRHVLVDHARRRAAKKRQGNRARELADEALSYWDRDPTELLALDEALTRLGEQDDSVLRVVELRYFSGLTLKAAGEALGMTERKASLAWSFARGWLKRELARGIAQ